MVFSPSVLDCVMTHVCGVVFEDSTNDNQKYERLEKAKPAFNAADEFKAAEKAAIWRNALLR